jgi:hypothetical protein
MPTRRRSMAARRSLVPQRRKRVWARETHSVTAGIASSNLQDLLTDYKALTGANQPPGVTVGGLIWTMSVRNQVASASNIALDQIIRWGIGVFPGAIDAADFILSDGVTSHYDWMDFGGVAFNSNETARMAPLFLDRRVRAQRKMEEVGEQLLLVLDAQGSVGSIACVVQVSTLLIMP